MSRLLLASAALSATASLAGADELLFAQPWTSTFAAPESVAIPSLGTDVEVADDFELVGSVGRLVVTGNACGSCPVPDVVGVHVRFHEWTPAGPGALQQDAFVPAGDPGFLFDPLAPDVLDVTLPAPFQAQGKHFVSVQLELGAWGIWGWWLSNHTAPTGSPLLVRDASAGGGWGPFVDVLGHELMADAAFELWSGDAGPLDPGSDPCGDWVAVPTPAPAGLQDVRLREVAVVASDDAWAVGVGEVPAGPSLDHFTVTLHWDGDAWSVVDSPSPALFPGPGGTDADLRAVAAAGTDDVWAAGGYTTTNLAGFSGTQILVLHWDGASWSQVEAPNSQLGSGNFVTAIEVVAPDDVWFVGDWLAGEPGGGSPLKAALAMHWDGSGFTVHETPYPVPSGNGYGLIDVDALASDDVWAVGAGHDGDMAALTTYIVHWDGTRWSHVPADPPGQLNTLYSVEAVAPDDVWVSGSYFDGVEGHPLLLHWDGSGWTQVDSPAAGALLHRTAPGETYASTGQTILRDDGAGWTQVMDFSGDSGVGLGSLASSGGGCQTLWVAGVDVVAGDAQPFTAHLVPPAGFDDLGQALAGAAGAPHLAGLGDPTPGGQVHLGVGGAAPDAPALLVAGFSTVDLPLLGGVLIPAPQIVVGLVVDADGQAGIDAPWPALPAGTTLAAQAWVLDAGGPQGFASTNGLAVTGH